MRDSQIVAADKCNIIGASGLHYRSWSQVAVIDARSHDSAGGVNMKRAVTHPLPPFLRGEGMLRATVEVRRRFVPRGRGYCA